MFAAAGYSLIYLLLGGGFGGAVLIFIVAKMLEPVMHFFEEMSVLCKYIPALGLGCRRAEQVIRVTSAMKSGSSVCLI
jgi:hypothetical protein